MLSKREIVLLCFFAIGLIALLTIRDIVDIKYNKFVIVVAVLSFSVFINNRVLAVETCFMFPLTWGLPYTYIFGGIVALYLIKQRTFHLKPVLLLIFFILLELLASIWYPEPNYSEIFKYFSVLSIFFLFLYDENIPRKECIRFFYYGTIALCVLIILSTIKNAPSNWLVLFSQGWFRFGSKNAEDVDGMMLSVNANTLAYYSLIGIIYAVNYLFEDKTNMRSCHILALILFLLSGILTVSLSWVATTSLCMCTIIALKMKDVKFFLSLLVIGAILLILAERLYFVTPELFDAIFAREGRVDLTEANDRIPLFWEYNKIFWSNIRFIIIGTGVVHYLDVTNIHNSMHNMTQQIFICMGIVPALIFLVSFLSPLKKYIKTPLINWIPIVAVLLFTQTIQFINPFSLMLPYVIAYYYLTIHSPEEKESL